MSDPVALELGGGVARLTLDRPEAGNAIDLDLARSLRENAESLAGRDDVGAVILQGSGKAFCVGGDLGFMHAAGDGVGDAVAELVGEFHAAITALRALDAPVIASVQGVAAGGGMSLALACDIAWAAESARFTMAYTAAGLTPDGGGTWTLPRIVGERRAAELILTNRRLDAAEALELGIVGRVVPDGELDEALGELAAGLAAGPTKAFGAAKRLLAESTAGASFADQLEAEGASISARAAEPDGREGIAAFLEKRRPSFGA
jgi:2-(1,2-epoxy-1,2-dihydrophenyl)acetyl-CoA isomerase